MLGLLIYRINSLESFIDSGSIVRLVRKLAQSHRLPCRTRLVDKRFAFKAARSSSGRMRVSGTRHLGSNPSLAALNTKQDVRKTVFLQNLYIFWKFLINSKFLKRSCKVTFSHSSPRLFYLAPKTGAETYGRLFQRVCQVFCD